MRVFIAGPYTKGDVAVNVRNVMVTGIELIERGYYPFVPHLYHFMHMQSPREYGVWTEQGLIWLEMCQALIRLPGESPGADHEVEEAEALGIPVFYSVAEFLDAEKE